MTYPEAIKKLRNKMLLTQTEFANLLGVKFGTVNRWEAGAFEPTMKTKRKLARLFKEHGIVVED
ncbi:MAG: helix-turn-helix transcriptional regulator [Bacilli bacterium]|nr:helix-turn-helix transcriptional regulator [Bacilli bacterium]